MLMPASMRVRFSTVMINGLNVCVITSLGFGPEGPFPLVPVGPSRPLVACIDALLLTS